MKLNSYTARGVKGTAVNMPKSWQEKDNDKLLAQAIRVYEWAKHPGLSKVKSRGEVRVSTRKIYRQKGTGMARHGDKGAPIFVGGGIAHGPKGVKRILKLSKKMRRKALLVSLSRQAGLGKILVVDGLSKLKKTKEAASLIDKIVAKEKEIKENARFTFALSEKNKEVVRVLRNIKRVEVVPFRNLNAYNVHFSGILVIDKQALKETVPSTKKQKDKKTEKKSSKSKSESKKKKGATQKKSA